MSAATRQDTAQAVQRAVKARAASSDAAARYAETVRSADQLLAQRPLDMDDSPVQVNEFLRRAQQMRAGRTSEPTPQVRA